MTMAKGVANGLPLGVTICTPAIADSLKTLTLSTFGGNPISATAANATIDVIERQHLAENAAKQGARLRAGLEALQRKHPKTIGDVRGMGLMQAIELVADETAATGRRPEAVTGRSSRRRRSAGSSHRASGGLDGNAFRISPALTVGPSEIAEALEILRESFDAGGAN